MEFGLKKHKIRAIILRRRRRQNCYLTVLRHYVCTKWKLCSIYSLILEAFRGSPSKVRFWPENGHFAFWDPLGGGWGVGGLRDNVRCSSLAHWKARGGLPIGVNWTFFTRCYGWGATSEYPLKIGDFAETVAVDPKFHVEGVAPPHQPFFFSEYLAKWSFVWYKNLDRPFFRFVTILAFARQTDGRTDGSLLYRVCILQRGKNCHYIAYRTEICAFLVVLIDYHGSFLCSL